MIEPTSDRPQPSATIALVPGAALLRAAPRLPWRRAALLVLAFFAAWLVLQVLFGLPFLFLASTLLGTTPMLFSGGGGTATSMTSLDGAALGLGLALGALCAVALLGRWGGPTLAAMGLRREGAWAREIVLGATLGPLLFALVLALELGLGWAKAERGAIDPGGLLLGALGYTGVAINEEVATRGFLLQVLARAWNPPGALIASSVLFAALHGPNPNATPFAIASLVAAGLMLASGYFATGRLWLPIALHWSWNFAQGPLFGFAVSGLPNDGVLAVMPTGPDWATGGGFGPEAGLAGLVAEAVAVAIIFAWRRAGGSATATLAASAGGLAGLAFLLLVAR